MTENALTVRNEMQVDRAKVNDLADRIAEFLPQSKSLPKDTRLAIAQIALAHRLDPFLGDIWAIPERNKVGGDWQVTGYRIMIGISAWRRAAQESGEYWGRHFEKCTDEERKWLGAGPNDLTIRCIIYRRKTGQQAAEFDGFGIFKADERSKMNPLQCVRLRAERDALKGAFPIGFGGGAIKIGVADDSGEEINGEHHDAPKWELTGSAPVDHDAPSLPEQPETPKPTAPDHDAELEAQIMSDAPDQKHEPKRQSYRMARVKFNGMTTDAWHTQCQAFCDEHPNWQIANTRNPDMNHILASAGHAGYEYITGENVQQMFVDIVKAHNEKAQA